MGTGTVAPATKRAADGAKQKSWKKVIVAGTVIACICVLWTLLRTLNSASIMLEIHFEQSAQGKNPDYSRFAISEVLAPEVLEAAAQKLGGRVDAQTLRAHLSLSDLATVASAERVNSAIYNSKENYAEYPVRYRLSYHGVSPMAGGLGAALSTWSEQLSYPSKGKILRAVAQSYEEYFQANHLQSDAVLSVDWETMDHMDYYNRGRALEVAIQRTGLLLREAYGKAPEFVSAQSGISFGDLVYELDQVSATATEKYLAYVMEKGLTVDRETLHQQLHNARESSWDIYERQTAAYEVCMQAISDYDPDTTRVVFIPSLDAENSFYMSRTKVGMDLLVEWANQAKSAADQAQHDALRYEYLLECFDVTQRPTDVQLQRGEELYQNVKNTMIPLLEQAGQMLVEKQERELQQIEFGQVNYGLHLVSMAFACVKPFVLLSICAYLGMCAWQTVGSMRKKREEEKAHVGE